jgi:hypothetical protein
MLKSSLNLIVLLIIFAVNDFKSWSDFCTGMAAGVAITYYGLTYYWKKVQDNGRKG